MNSEAKIVEKINSIYKKLKNFADEYKIISRAELRDKIKELFQEYPLTKEEEKFLEEKNESTPLNYLFLSSIKEIPDSINAPSLIEHLNHEDITFYYGHTFKIDDTVLEKAKQRVYQFKEEKMNPILQKFFIKSRYDVKIPTKNEIVALKNNLKLKVLVLPSIILLESKIKDLNLEENLILAVPTGNSPGPYLNFFKLHANKILLNKSYVWIIDIEDESVSPFIGYLKDRDLNSNFKSSQLARYAQRVIKMDIDEDF